MKLTFWFKINKQVNVSIWQSPIFVKKNTLWILPKHLKPPLVALCLKNTPIFSTHTQLVNQLSPPYHIVIIFLNLFNRLRKRKRRKNSFKKWITIFRLNLYRIIYETIGANKHQLHCDLLSIYRFFFLPFLLFQKFMW